MAVGTSSNGDMTAHASSALQRNLAQFALFLLMILALVESFLVPEAKNFQNPQLARIFFWHFPCPIIASVLLIMSSVWSLLYLVKGKPGLDVQAVTSLELGALFSSLTMIHGMIFSRAEWGAWWQWDPRQNSFLLVLLIIAGYFVLRSAFSDPTARKTYSSAYSVFSILPILFLIFVFPRLPQIAGQSLHPTNTIMSGQVNGSYGYTIMITLTLLSLLTVWLYRYRLKAGLFELRVHEYLFEL